MDDRYSGWVASAILTSLLITDAQAAVTIPGSADVSRIPARYQPAKTLPKTQKPLPISKPAKVQYSTAAQAIRFTLHGIKVSGSTVYTQQQLSASYQDFLGKRINIADLQTIADALTTRYRQDGYILTRAVVPPQHILHGLAEIQVVEGYIDRVDVAGIPAKRAKLLLAYAEKIAKVKPVTIQAIERYALLANDVPGMTVHAVLAPSKTQIGASDLTFAVTPARVQGYIAYDNRGTRFLGPHQVSVGGDINNVLNRSDQTGVHSVVTTNTRELKYFELHHSEFIGTNGAQLTLSVSDTLTRPGATLAKFEVRGISKDATMTLQYPLIRSRARNLYVHSTLDYLDSKTKILNLQLYNDHIRSLRLGLDYDRTDDQNDVNTFGFELSQGLPFLGNSHIDPDVISRPDGHSIYTKLNFSASHLHSLPKGFSLLLAADSQYSFQPLLAAEQFGYGGAQFGQGYDSSALTGDNGVEGKLEVRYDMQTMHRYLQSAQYYVFYDGGLLWNRDQTSQIDRQSGTSAGLGARLGISHTLSSSIEIAKPLTHKADIPNTNAKAPRVFFAISWHGDSAPSQSSDTGLTAANAQVAAAAKQL